MGKKRVFMELGGKMEKIVLRFFDYDEDSGQLEPIKDPGFKYRIEDIKGEVIDLRSITLLAVTNPIHRIYVDTGEEKLCYAFNCDTWEYIGRC
jgi:hypothetical protein